MQKHNTTYKNIHASQTLAVVKKRERERELLLTRICLLTMACKPLFHNNNTKKYGNYSLIGGNCLPIPGNQLPIPGNQLLIPGNQSSIPGKQLLIIGNRSSIPGNQLPIPGKQSPVPGNLQLKTSNYFLKIII